MKKTKKTVYLVGAGPGDPGLLTVRAATVIAQAEVLIYDRLVNPEVFSGNRRAEKIYVGKDPRTKRKGREQAQDQINRLLVRHASRGKTVVRLKGGDPFVFGRGGEEALFLKQNRIPFEIVPGVTAGHAVPAYAGIPLTDREHASQVAFVTGHEDPLKNGSAINWRSLAAFEGTLVAFMSVKSLPRLVRGLLVGGKDPQTPVAVIQSGTLPGQRTVTGPLGHITELVKKAGLEPPALAVIGETVRMAKKLDWYSKSAVRTQAAARHPLAGKTVLVTRARAQAGRLTDELERRGARVLEFPVIEIKPPRSYKALDRALQHPGQFDWIVFASVNAVEHVFGRLAELGMDMRHLAGLKIASVGKTTSAALASRGIQADLCPRQFTAEALAKSLKAKKLIAGRHFLLPRTDIAPESLDRILRNHGARVTQVIAYRTVSLPEGKQKLRRMLEKDTLDYVTFTSSSTVTNFFKALDRKKLPARTCPVSIGPVTSQTLRKYFKKRFKEAREHTIPGLVEEIIHGK